MTEQRQSPASNRMDYRGFTARSITSSAYLLSGCFHMSMYGREFHTHASAYLVVGSGGSILIDTGHAKDAPAIEAFIRSVVGNELTWIFPTHEEYPHAGNLATLLRAFPRARAVGEVRNYHLYYPDLAAHGRFHPVAAGGSIDLGNRRIAVLPGIIHDLPATAWAYDDRDGLLFVSDGFGFSHYGADQCGLTSGELPFAPSLKDTRMVLDLALYWSRFADNTGLVAAMRELMVAHPPRAICPAHGNVITELPELTKLMEASLLANGVRRAPHRVVEGRS